MHPFVDLVRPWAELLYFASGVVVAMAAIRALAQLRLMKQDVCIRNERASAEQAIQHVSRYAGEYVRLCNVEFDERKSRGLPDYCGTVEDFSPQSLSEADRKVATRRCFEADKWAAPLNELELIAAAFVSGVADERIGFRVIGRSFCANVGFAYDRISLLRYERQNAPYQSIVDLYGLWAPRLTKAELADERSRLEARMSRIPDKVVPPIGTSAG